MLRPAEGTDRGGIVEDRGSATVTAADRRPLEVRPIPPTAPPHADPVPDANATAERLAERLAVPALIAALASVPAVFLTLADGTLATTGRVIDLLAAAVLLVEGGIPLVVAHDRRRWLRQHRWLLLVIAVAVPAAVFAAGPAQVLRLVRSVGALRVLRVRRIVRAGRVATERLALSHRGRRVAVGAATVTGSVFVALLLADPTSSSGGLARRAVDVVGPAGVAAAGVLLAGATFVVVRERSSRDE